jgi:hypothetical protein
MGYHRLHRNTVTKELLSQDVQVCTVCWKNFSSDDAWEKHWDRKKSRDSQCLAPEAVGLVHFINTFGSKIYKVN